MEGLIYFILCFAVFIIGVFITRWIFGINKILKNLHYQSYQLAVMRKIISKMAAKEELTADDIKKIEDATSVHHLG